MHCTIKDLCTTSTESKFTQQHENRDGKECYLLVILVLYFESIYLLSYVHEIVF